MPIVVFEGAVNGFEGDAKSYAVLSLTSASTFTTTVRMSWASVALSPNTFTFVCFTFNTLTFALMRLQTLNCHYSILMSMAKTLVVAGRSATAIILMMISCSCHLLTFFNWCRCAC